MVTQSDLNAIVAATESSGSPQKTPGSAGQSPSMGGTPGAADLCGNCGQAAATETPLLSEAASVAPLLV